jgi:Rrf2 family transcriptional regulator, cysteine metabolism repressor
VHISTRCRYAIKALVRLALSYGGVPVQSRDIAGFGGIPVKYLEQVMHDLRQGGLVTSTRGKNGGYVLARSPGSITFAQVREIIDGPDEAERMPGAGQADAFVEPVWHDVRQAVHQVLAGATIGAAAERARSTTMYAI